MYDKKNKNIPCPVFTLYFRAVSPSSHFTSCEDGLVFGCWNRRLASVWRKSFNVANVVIYASDLDMNIREKTRKSIESWNQLPTTKYECILHDINISKNAVPENSFWLTHPRFIWYCLGRLLAQTHCHIKVQFPCNKTRSRQTSCCHVTLIN